MNERGTLLQPGQIFEGFHVRRLLGRGGAGEVYEVALNGGLHALKVVAARSIQKDSDLERLLREGKMLSHIRHPNVVAVQDSGVTKDRLIWIRMELLKGQPLRVLLHRYGRMSVRLACTYLRWMALGAHQCHTHGIVHRDLKPENVFITTDEQVKLLDFGIAKFYWVAETKDGSPKGTPLYMAPEQIRGEPASPATDIYAISVMAFEMLWGKHPWVNKRGEYEMGAVFHKHLSVEPPRLTQAGVPAAVADVVARGLRKDPAARQQNGLEFAMELWNAFESLQQSELSPDTYPGEPATNEIPECTSDVMRFGTGPEGRTPARLGGAIAARTLPHGARLPERIESVATLPPPRSRGSLWSGEALAVQPSERDPMGALARALGSDWDADDVDLLGGELHREWAPTEARSERRRRTEKPVAVRRDTLPLPQPTETEPDGGPSTLRGAGLVPIVGAEPLQARRSSTTAPGVRSADTAASRTSLERRARQVGFFLAAATLGYLVRAVQSAAMQSVTGTSIVLATPIYATSPAVANASALAAVGASTAIPAAATAPTAAPRAAPRQHAPAPAPRRKSERIF